MAKNSKARHVSKPPSPSSSEEDEMTTDEEEQGVDVDQKAPQLSDDAESEEDSEGEEQEKAPPRTPPVRKPSNDQEPKSSSKSSEDDSDTETASDIPLKPHLTLKPAHLSSIASDSKTKSKSGKEDCHTPKPQEKKAMPKRLWRDEDQIALLQSVIDYKAVKGIDPQFISSDLYDFIKDKLGAAFSKTQVSDKIKRLKKKFFTLYEKGDLSTLCPADSKVYELSTDIWGSKISATGEKTACNANNSKGKAVEASNAKVKKRNESRKADEASNAVDSPKDVAETKKRKLAALKDEKIEEKRQKTALGGKDGQTSVDSKGKENASKGSQKAAKLKDDHTSGGQDNQAACEVNCIEITMNDVIGAGMENQTEDFQSKYPHLIKSINKMNYPFGNEELFDRFKEKATLLDCSVAMELEEGWAEVWEEYGKISEKLAKLVSKQTTLLNDA